MKILRVIIALSLAILLIGSQTQNKVQAAEVVNIELTATSITVTPATPAYISVRLTNALAITPNGSHTALVYSGVITPSFHLNFVTPSPCVSAVIQVYRHPGDAIMFYPKLDCYKVSLPIVRR